MHSWLVVFLLVCLKALAFRIACGKPSHELEPDQQKIVWMVSFIPAISSLMLTCILSVCCMPFLAMANKPLTGSPGDIFAELVVGLSIYGDWALNAMLIPMGYRALVAAKLNRGVASMILAYFGVTILEYVVCFCGSELIMPRS